MSADFWAGYMSGAAGIIIGNPLDLIKTRLQAGNKTALQNVVVVDGVVAAHQQQSVQSFRAHFENAGTLVRGEIYLIIPLLQHHHHHHHITSHTYSYPLS